MPPIAESYAPSVAPTPMLIWKKPAILSTNMSVRRRHHRRRRAVGPLGRDRRQAARPRLPGARAGRAGQLDLSLSAADGVLHHAGAARDRRAAVRLAVRQADARRGAAATTARSSTPTICRSRSTRRCSCDRARGGRGGGASVVRGRDAVGAAACAASGTRAHVVLAIGYYDHPVLLGVPGRRSAARPPLLQRAASVLPPARRDRRRRQLGGRVGARDVSRRRARDARAPRAELKSTIKYWVRPDIENRIKEGSIARVQRVRNPRVVVIARSGRRRAVRVGRRRSAVRHRRAHAGGDSGRRRVPADRLSRRRAI